MSTEEVDRNVVKRLLHTYGAQWLLKQIVTHLRPGVVLGDSALATRLLGAIERAPND